MQYREDCTKGPLALGKTEQFDASTVRFLSEQDGAPEQALKGRLTQLFHRHGCVIRGYLAQVDYGNPDEFNVVLCLRLIGEPKTRFMGEINRVFSETFRSDEHLDVMILEDAQEAELLGVCQPFYGSTDN